MEDSNSEKKSVFAQTVLTSVFVSVGITLGVAFIARQLITDYVFYSIEPKISSLIPDVPEYISDESKIISSISKADPAVVSIIVTKDVPVYEQYYETFNPWGLFGGFQIPRIRENGTEEREVGGGTGFIVTSDGLIVTNRHVVNDDAARYSVVLTDGKIYSIDILAKDEQLDVAILKISDSLEGVLPTVTFGDSSSLKLGQTVIAIGNALAEFKNSVSVGVISGLSRSIVASDNSGFSEQLNQVIQTDAAINPGNSGGPLLNLDGEVIGINVATSEGADNIGFALPANVVRQVVESVKTYGEIVRPYLGVRYVMLTEDNAKDFNVTVTRGALIKGDTNFPAIAVGSAAEKSGLKEGDVILSIDGESLAELDLATLLRTKSVGQEISLLVERNGVQENISVILEKAI